MSKVASKRVEDVGTLTRLIGSNLNGIRTQRGITFEQLAKLAGVSKGMLVQIEQGRTNPSVGTLCKIANALGVAVSSFIESVKPAEVRIVPQSDATQLWTGRSGGTGKLVVGFDEPALTEFWAWHILPGEWHDGLAHPAGSHEILFVQSGELSLSIEGRTYQAKAGETVMFVADRPHRYANESDKDLKLLMLTCEPDRKK